MILIGGDLLAIGGTGGSIRAVTAPLVIAGAILLANPVQLKLDTTATILFGLWMLAGALSISTSYASKTSIAYTAWIAFDYLFIVVVFYNIALRIQSRRLMDLWFLVFRLHVLLLGVELILRVGLNIEGKFGLRPHLWFYEPSYVAVFLGGYFMAAIYQLGHGHREYGADVFLAIIGLLLLASATAAAAIVLGILVSVLFTPARWKILFWSMLVGCLAIFIGYEWFYQSTYFNLIIGFSKRLFDHDGAFLQTAWTVLTERGGNRFARAFVGWNAFIHHPILGIGLGADRAYMGSQPFSPQEAFYIRNISSNDFNAQGMPFTNIFIDVLGSMGVSGFIPFSLILFYAVWKLLKYNDVQGRALLLAFLMMIALLQTDGNFLRYYLWMPLGLGLGVVCRSRGGANASNSIRET